MSEITIVTAFFDIGRGSWTPAMEQRGGPLPHYLERDNQTYLDRFEHLATLGNEIIVFTHHDLVPQVMEIKQRLSKANLVIIPMDARASFSRTRAQIRQVMDLPDFPTKINPAQVRNPEYWCEDYVLVTSLKANFVADAINRGLTTNDQVAWVDFGYCRDISTLGGKTKWEYDFDPEVIHFWNCQAPNMEHPMDHVAHAVINNEVIIFGACVVAHKKHWNTLATVMRQSLDMLMANGLVDDDQGLWLVAYFSKPDMFELHPISYNDPFVVFRDYNSCV